MEIIKHGVNGYVVPMNMDFDINIIKKIPKVKNYDNGVTYQTWLDELGGGEYMVKKISKVKIKALHNYKDVQEGRDIKRGEVYEVKPIRAKEIVDLKHAIYQ